MNALGASLDTSDGTCTFEGLGLDARILKSVSKKRGWKVPTQVQRVAIPCILKGKDAIVRADTGRGKTLAYLLPLIHKIIVQEKRQGWKALVLVPTRELCKQVSDEVTWLAQQCGHLFGITNLAAHGKDASTKSALASVEEIVVSTPATIADCLRKGLLPQQVLRERLGSLVLDEADLLLSYGYGEDLQVVSSNVPRSCQCICMSATLNEDVEELKKLVLHNPEVVDVLETKASGARNGSVGVADTVTHHKVSCEAKDKLLYVTVAIKMGLVSKKTLTFVNSVNSGYKLKLFLENFGVRSAILNWELPLNSRQHILQEFNKGLFDHLIATDSASLRGKGAEKRGSERRKKGAVDDGEYGVVRGIDFRGVRTVINFELPADVTGYVHRAGRTGRAGKRGSCVTFYAPEEGALLEQVHDHLSQGGDQHGIQELEGMTKAQVEAFRYRGEDVARRITRNAIMEARAREIRSELLNSERLQSHFEDNPKDLALLKHDRTLQKHPSSSHLKNVPNYMRDAKTLAAVSDLSKKRKSESSGRRAKRQDPVKAPSFLPAFRLGKSKEDDELTQVERSVFGSKLWAKQKPSRGKANVRKNKRRNR